MPTHLDDTLSAGALNETERRAGARIVARLQAELGDDLLAVWLYGSRAREADPYETDPDRRSDVDLLAIIDSSRDTEEAALWALPMVEAEADEIGDCARVLCPVFMCYCDLMKNLTVSVPDDVYRLARVRAAEGDTSVSSLVTGYLRSLGDRDAQFERLEAQQRRIQGEITGFSARHNIDRDALHERSVR